jgi:hypothetical protein
MSQKEMDAAFSMDFTGVYKQDYGSPNVLQFGKNPASVMQEAGFY